jgi:hypothetical protein
VTATWIESDATRELCGDDYTEPITDPIRAILRRVVAALTLHRTRDEISASRVSVWRRNTPSKTEDNGLHGSAALP